MLHGCVCLALAFGTLHQHEPKHVAIPGKGCVTATQGGCTLCRIQSQLVLQLTHPAAHCARVMVHPWCSSFYLMCDGAMLPPPPTFLVLLLVLSLLLSLLPPPFHRHQVLFPSSYASTARQVLPLSAAAAAQLASCEATLTAALQNDATFNRLAGGMRLLGRTKSLYSIMRKLLRLQDPAAGSRRLGQMYDLLGLRAVVLPRRDLPTDMAEEAARQACYRLQVRGCVPQLLYVSGDSLCGGTHVVLLSVRGMQEPV